MNRDGDLSRQGPLNQDQSDHNEGRDDEPPTGSSHLRLRSSLGLKAPSLSRYRIAKGVFAEFKFAVRGVLSRVDGDARLCAGLTGFDRVA